MVVFHPLVLVVEPVFDAAGVVVGHWFGGTGCSVASAWSGLLGVHEGEVVPVFRDVPVQAVMDAVRGLGPVRVGVSAERLGCEAQCGQVECPVGE